MLTDCSFCLNTPCTCGWEYRRWGVGGLKALVGVLNRVIEFKEKFPDARFSGVADTHDDEKFKEWIGRSQKHAKVITEECTGGVQVWYGCRCWLGGAEAQIIRFSEIELEEIPE